MTFSPLPAEDSPALIAGQFDEATGESAPPRDIRDDYKRAYWLVFFGWMPMYVSGAFSGLPTTFLLKDIVHLNAEQMALFSTITNAPSYIKPLYGIFSDAVPLFGTRRRHYLVLGCLITGIIYIAMGFVPKTFGWLLAMNLLVMVFLVLVSTVMGGLMMDVGLRHNATGGMSAQRTGLGKVEALLSGPIGAFMAKQPYPLAIGLTGLCYLLLAPYFWFRLDEKPTASLRADRLVEAKRQLKAVFASKTLWKAAALIVLVAISPGFGTPMLFYQTDTLGFSKDFLGMLGFLGGASGLGGAFLYGRYCRTFTLRQLLTFSIVIHAAATLFYLLYRSPQSAVIITTLEGMTGALAILPLYDLCARATPRGSEALGYSVMMSVWNLTNQLSNLLGSYLYTTFDLTFMQLVYLNAGSTILVLLAVPFLPKAMVDRREGEAEA